MALKQNIIYIYFKGKHLVTSKSQYQYNHGQYLYFADLNLPQAFEVHFSNKDKGESKTQIGSNKLVEIPDEYFWSGASQIYAWVYLHSEINDGETIYEVRIPLIKRAKPTDEEPLPQQESVMERAIAELNNAVEITTENANKTEADKTQVSNIKEDIIDLKEDIDNTADTVDQKAQEAINASLRSEASAQNAAEYESGAHNYSQQAEQSASEALGYKNVAKQKAEIATDASAEALGYRDEALDAKNKAEQAKQNIVDYRDETKGYRDETLNIKNDVQILKGQIDETASDVSDISASVKADAQSASNSADDASQSANSADQSAESASLSESKARQSEINAYNSANDASQSAEQARQFKNQSETNASHYPKIVNGFWYVWDASNNEFKNTDVDAHGLKGDKGDKGDTGNGIASTVLNSDYTLTITFTDGTTYKSQSIRGEKGLKGDKGDTGNGIASTVLNNDYTLTVTFTDGTTYTTPSIRGQQGEKGDKGDVGESGVYIGTDEPQDEGIKVWIDTNEAGTEADLIQDVVDLKEENKKIIANLATDTASGSIASFSDGADNLPLKSLVVDIDPVQDLHGQANPYPAGGGKNVFPPPTSISPSSTTTITNNNGVLAISSTGAGQSNIHIPSFTFAESGQKIELLNSFTSAVIRFCYQGEQVDYFSLSSANRVIPEASITLLQGKTIDEYRIQLNGATNGTLAVMVTPSTDSALSAFSPYENICPISGWTQVGVEQSGVNVWDEETEVGGIAQDSGADTSNTSYRRTGYIPVVGGQSYFACIPLSIMVFWYDRTKGFISRQSVTTSGGGTITAPSNARFMRFRNYSANAWETYNHDISINYPNTDHDYHPYTGRSITINLGQTVYGAKLYPIEGKAVIDMAMAVFDGTEMYYNNYYPTVVCGKRFTKGDASGNSFVNSHLPSLNAACNYANSDKQAFQFAKANEYWGVSSADELKAIFAQQYANGTPVTICYPLAEPIEIQLSPNQVNSLLGVNNIWADSGDTTAEYRADTSLYVKRKITEAIAALS